MKYSKWFKSFLPYLMADRHTSTERQELLVISMLVVGAVVYFLFSIINYSHGFYALSMYQFVLWLINLICLSLPNRVLSIEKKGNIAVLAVTMLLWMLYFYGGLENTGIYWLPILPFIVFSMVGIRRGWLWLGTFIMGLMLLHSISNTIEYPIPYTTVQTVQMLTGFTVFVIVAFIFEALRLQHYHELEQNNARLFEAREQLEVTLDERESEIERQTVELRNTNHRLRKEIVDHEETSKALAVTEKEFYQSQKMESLGNLVEQVTKNFSDALSEINSSLFFIQRQIKGNEAVQERLDAMEKTVFHASGITGQLLTFARKDRAEEDSVDMGKLARDIKVLAPVVLGEDIQLKLAVSEFAMPVRGSASELQQVLMNLLGNANEAVQQSENKEISLNVFPLLEVDELRQKHPVRGEEWIYISVVDHGIGIEASHKPKIFEPFFSTKASSKGAGLGLAMCYGAIKSYGGLIEVDSTPGEGTTFHLYLPMEGFRQTDVEIGNTAQITGRGETLLLLDESEQLYSGYKRVLESLNYHLKWAGSRDEAMALLGEKVDVVVLDTSFAHGEIRTLVEQIQQRAPEVKILFTTAYIVHDSGSDFENYRRLNKPFTVQQFCSTIRDILD